MKGINDRFNTLDCGWQNSLKIPGWNQAQQCPISRHLWINVVWGHGRFVVWLPELNSSVPSWLKWVNWTHACKFQQFSKYLRSFSGYIFAGQQQTMCWQHYSMKHILESTGLGNKFPTPVWLTGLPQSCKIPSPLEVACL